MHKSNKTQIFVAYHKNSMLFENEIFTPIQVGKKNSGLKLSMLSDDTGENIAHKNKNYCELTALYWIWKNCKSEYIGLCHYRRLFNLNCADSAIDQPINVMNPNAVKQVWDSMNTEKVLENLFNIDLILPSRESLNDDTVETHYTYHHRQEDWKIMVDVLREKYSDWEHIIQKVSNQNYEYFYNMFIMKNNLFNDYMTWLFDIFNEIETRITISEDSYQSRVFGFMGERLFNFYIEYLKREKHIKIKEVQTIFIDFDNYCDPVEVLNKQKDEINKFIENNTKSQLKVCFYGAGKFATELLNRYDFSGVNLLGFIDKNINKHGAKINNYNIFHINELNVLKPDILFLSVLQKNTVINEIESFRKDNNLSFSIISIF